MRALGIVLLLGAIRLVLGQNLQVNITDVPICAVSKARSLAASL